MELRSCLFRVCAMERSADVEKNIKNYIKLKTRKNKYNRNNIK